MIKSNYSLVTELITFWLLVFAKRLKKGINLIANTGKTITQKLASGKSNISCKVYLSLARKHKLSNVVV